MAFDLVWLFRLCLVISYAVIDSVCGWFLFFSLIVFGFQIIVIIRKGEIVEAYVCTKLLMVVIP